MERACDGDARGPHVVKPRRAATAAELAELIDVHRSTLRDRLAWVGPILFRGFAIDDAAALARVTAAFSDAPALGYRGGDTPRERVGDGVYTSTEVPAGVGIPLHSEMSYLSRHPRHLLFACAGEPTRGGETTLADTRSVYEAMAPTVRERFVEHGVRYTRVIRGRSRAFELLDRLAQTSKSWMEVFETDRRDEAEARCRELALDCRWLPSGHLVTSTVQPAAIAHTVTAETAWFNQAHLFCFSPRWMGRLYYAGALALHPWRSTRTHQAEYGDGRPIDDTTLSHVHDVLDEQTVTWQWRRGDLLVFDNETTMHGRTPFSGPRRLLVSMTSD